MKKIKYSAIAYCSSQKSALTGQPGFGVRSYTNGFDTNICDYLSSERDINDNPQTKAYGYELPDDRKLLFADIEANADVVKDYPVSYTYKTLLTPNKIYYVLARTVYVGIDYGYFCGIETARRVGANYYSHILLFDEKPPKEIFTLLIENNCFQNNTFLPLNYSCLPDNQELTHLITGDPVSLPSDEFCIEESLNAVDITDSDADIIIGILQLYINKKHGLTDKRMIVKAPHREAARFVGFLKSQLPAYLVDDILFQTNYNKSGTPKDIDAIFVNEHYFGGELYETDHVCVDLFTNQHIGVDKNYIYDRVKELVASKDLETLTLLLDYLSSFEISSNTDYEFIYKLFVLAKSRFEMTIYDLPLSFIDKLNKFKLGKSDNAAVWGRINTIINDAISSRDNSQIKLAIDLIGHIGASKDIIISDASKVLFTKHVFDVPNNFGEVISNKSVDITISLIAKVEIKDSARLFVSLKTLSDSVVWDKYIKLCFPAGEIEKRYNLIINEILSANFAEAEQQSVINLLYKNNVKPIIAYIVENPENICALRKTTEELCSNNIELIVKFINAANNDANTLSIFKRLVDSYFVKKMTAGNSIKNVSEYVDFANQITIATANMLGAFEVVDRFAMELQKNPDAKTKDVISKILDSGIDISKQSRKTLEDIYNIICDKAPDCVDRQLMKIAYMLDKKELLYPMFELWIKNRVSIDVLKDYINDCERLQRDPKFIKHMIVSVWKSTTSNIRENKEGYIISIIDNAKWTQQEYKEFLGSCDDPELAAFISKANSFIKKMMRKLFKS
ncbi:MAG: hypothetical protein SNI49_08660 [Rikenellaceae bacterium]